METTIVNSKSDAMSFWVNEYGEPETYTSYEELLEAEMKLEDFRSERDNLTREIESRNVNSMNEYKVNRAIELHFLVTAGDEYLESCATYAGMLE